MNEHTIIKAADNTNASGALIGLAGWAASVNWIGWAGVLIALAGFWVSFHYQRGAQRRERGSESKKAVRIFHTAFFIPRHQISMA